MREQVTIIGAGLAGTEAAWQLAEAGLDVTLVEMKPKRRTPAQTTDQLAELVCSNSLRSYNVLNAVGLIKEEMRRLGSLIIRAALASRVPAGDALAVDRDAFSGHITEALRSHPRITLVSDVVNLLPAADAGHVIVATGPLTAEALAADIKSVSGQNRLYFYDSIAPIIAGESIDRDVVFAASRYGKGEGADYLNCPLDKPGYDAFIDALRTGICAPLHDFEKPKYFEGCLPIEVLAERGKDALRFGPMKPVGLTDPRTGRRPYAVVQLRREDADGQAWNLVGFQTKLKHGEQKRVFAMLPGLERAEILRYGAIHRNTYLDSPVLLDERMRLRARPNVRFAGQITGVEGYVESSAHGLLVAKLLASDIAGRAIPPPPRACALGALIGHVTGAHRLPGRPHEPQNVNWSMFPPVPPDVPKSEIKRRRVARAFEALEAWARAAGLPLAPPAIAVEDLPASQRQSGRPAPASAEETVRSES